MGKKYKGFKGSGMQPKHITKEKERAEIEAMFAQFVIEKCGIKNGVRLLSLMNNLRSGAGGEWNGYYDDDVSHYMKGGK